MRILILADDCNPELPSLPLVAYKATRAIADHADVVVATHIRNRRNIEKVGFGNARVRYFDSEYVARPVYSLSKLLRGGEDVAWTIATALAYPSYLAFEWEVWKGTQHELRNGAFDIVHRISPMSPTLPSPMSKWSPVPFVLGPLNGGLKWPRAFSQELAREREWLTYMRNVYRWLPYQKFTYERSTILAAFQHTIQDLPRHARTRAINFPEIGIDPQIFDQCSVRPARKRKTILFVGRLVPYKLPQVVVRAFVERPALHAHRLVIVGEGPERPAIERIIQNNSLESQVELLGWKSQAEVAALMQEADIFAFPSIRELGAGALIEAMACGLACVVVDYGAPSTLIEGQRGLKVPLAPRDQLIEQFGRALQDLVADEDASIRVGLAAHQYAKQFYTWDVKARKMLSVYKWVLGCGDRPDFWAP
jgi:glycosyltransferase involved in cell wall biosynthesis